MKKPNDNPSKILLYLGYTAVVILFITFVLPHLLKFLLPFIVAAFISLIINPLVNFLTNRIKINRRISTVFSIIAILGVIGFALYGVLNQVVDYVYKFAIGLPEMLSNKFEQMPGWLKVIEDFFLSLPDPVKQGVQKITSGFPSNITGVLTPATSATLAFAGNTASKIPSAFIFSVVTILATYFMTYDRGKMYEFVKSITGEKKLGKMYLVKTRLVEVLKAYIKAQLIMMCIMFALLLFGFSIIGVKHSFIVALITAVIDAVPILGTGTIVIPWAFISLITGEFTMALELIVLYITALFIRQFFEPKVVSSQIGLHPLITLISMYIGFVAIGIFGMILGPIVSIVVIKAFEITKEQKEGDGI